MNNSKLKTGRDEEKIYCNDFREFLQMDAIKNESREIEIFSECNSYQEQNKGKFDAKNPNLEELCHSECPENSFTSNTVQIKKEEDIDIFYEDIKSAVDEQKSSKSFRFCEMCNQSIGVETDIFKSTSYRFECSCQKPNESLSYNSCREVMTPFGLTTGSYFNSFNSETYLVDHDHNYAIHSCHAPIEEKLHEKNLNPKDLGQYKLSENTVRVKNEDDIDIFYEDIKSETGEKKSDMELKPLAVQNETTSGDEAAEKQDSSVVPRRLSVPSKETEKEMENQFCPEPLDNNPSVAVKIIHCKICSKSFSRMGNLKTHEKRHTGDKRFHCKLCSKSFFRKDNLKTHEWCHTGNKPFCCKICSKTFTTSGYLKVHERGHTGDKPFHCKLCLKSFFQMDKLKIHQGCHNPNKPFHCQICSKTFTRSSYLKVHGRVHTGERPFQCKICSKSFSQMGTLKIHERSH